MRMHTPIEGKGWEGGGDTASSLPCRVLLSCSIVHSKLKALVSVASCPVCRSSAVLTLYRVETQNAKSHGQKHPNTTVNCRNLNHDIGWFYAIYM